MWFRVIALAILAYVVADFSDPFVPGVFFFESEQLFVDGVVTAKLNVAAVKAEATGSQQRTSLDALPAASGSLVIRPTNGNRYLLRRMVMPRSTKPSVSEASPSDDAPLA